LIKNRPKSNYVINSKNIIKENEKNKKWYFFKIFKIILDNINFILIIKFSFMNKI
jgi:hypothetical protein